MRVASSIVALALATTAPGATLADAPAADDAVSKGPTREREAKRLGRKKEGKPEQGQWRRIDAPKAAAGSTSDAERDLAFEEDVARLEAIGYLPGVESPPDASRVTIHDRDRAVPGLNFYTSGHAPEAILMDMEGTELHRWRMEFDDAFPNRALRGRDIAGKHYFRRAHLLAGGDVIAVYGGVGIVRIDKDSKLVWAYDALAHHDVHVLPDGEIYGVIRVIEKIPRINPKRPIAVDYIVRLGPDGREKQRWSVLEALENSDYQALWDRDVANQGDIFHTNAVRVLGEGADAKNPAFKPGRILTSMRALDAIAVIDLPTNRVVWAHRGSYKKQHDPRVLDNGNLLLFDNLGIEKRSRVFEFDPREMSEVWQYAGTPARPLYSFACGASARLADGNTLIVESGAGRAIEVTPGGEVVWEFVSPHRAGDDNEFIGVLFDMHRLDPAIGVGWLEPRVENR